MPYGFRCDLFFSYPWKGKKGKVFPVHTTKAYGGSRDIGSLVLNFGTRERTVDKYTPLSLYVRERTPVPI